MGNVVMGSNADTVWPDQVDVAATPALRYGSVSAGRTRCVP